MNDEVDVDDNGYSRLGLCGFWIAAVSICLLIDVWIGSRILTLMSRLS